MLCSLLGSDRCMTMHWLGWSREAINSSVMIILLTWDKDGMKIALCGAGWVDWKWECHPVVGLGEPCITSAQCRTRPGSPSHLCHPINHKCSCQRGFSPTVSTNYSLVCTEISTQVALL